MTRFAVKTAYLGPGFFGSQRQADKRTVEGELLKAIEKCCAERPPSDHSAEKPHAPSFNFQSAGRTDRGVSALGMVFAFDCETGEHGPKACANGKLNLGQLNHHLPQDICCYAQATVPPGFNPRSAQERHYRYFLPQTGLADNHNVGESSKRTKAAAPDLKKMRSAARLLEGTHDFSNFCKKSERNPVRTITKITVTRAYIDFFAESFLWQQVRRMSYAILQAGGDAAAEAKGGKEDVTGTSFFAQGKPFPPLPPENLLLVGLKYPMNFHTDQRILADLKARMRMLAENKRAELEICRSFVTSL